MFNSKKLFGFTMPEVLIVVGIIGVVAAITTPITNKYFNDIAFEPASKKTVLLLQETLDIMNSDQILDSFNSTEEFISSFKNYVKVEKVCPVDNLTGCFPSTFTANDQSFALSEMETSDGFGKDWDSDTVGVLLKNGTSLLITYNPYCSKKNPFNCIAAVFDVDSINKNNVYLGNNLSDLGTFNANFTK